MPFNISTPAESLLKDRQSHRLARCWDVLRVDGTRFRFTDHSHQLILADGFTYVPTKGISASALRKQSALEENNVSVAGIVSSDVITYDDLAAGKFKEARIDEYTIDWLYPWVDPIHHQRFWLVETSWNGEDWEGQVSSLPFWLRHNFGDVATRNCRAELGDTKCKVDLTLFQVSIEVSSVITPRQKFVAALASTSDDYYAGGRILWLTGNQASLTSEVKAHVNAADSLELYLRTPFAIQVGDQGLLVPGCDFTRATCVSKFNNIVNFRGYPFMPGSDKAYQTPLT